MHLFSAAVCFYDKILQKFSWGCCSLELINVVNLYVIAGVLLNYESEKYLIIDIFKCRLFLISDFNFCILVLATLCCVFILYFIY